MISKPRTVYDAIKVFGHDIDFEPHVIPEPTSAAPGSVEKLCVLRKRLEAGEDLYHFGDETIAARIDSQVELLRYAMAHAANERDENRARAKR